jgi:hypothetical protein
VPYICTNSSVIFDVFSKREAQTWLGEGGTELAGSLDPREQGRLPSRGNPPLLAHMRPAVRTEGCGGRRKLRSDVGANRLCYWIAVKAIGLRRTTRGRWGEGANTTRLGMCKNVLRETPNERDLANRRMVLKRILTETHLMGLHVLTRSGNGDCRRRRYYSPLWMGWGIFVTEGTSLQPHRGRRRALGHGCDTEHPHPSGVSTLS